MRQVLKDRQQEIQFQKDGYIIVPFLNESEVQSLRKQYFDTIAQSGGLIQSEDAGINDVITYDFTFIDKNIEYKRLVFNVITNVFAPHVAHYLDAYKPIIANFIRKKTNAGEVPLHQNWAFVDEKKCTSVSIWCPLVDSNEENGTLQVVPGSHKRFGEVRGPMIPWELENIKQTIIENHLVPMNVKAGEAVILDDSIVHYSAINKKDELRLAIQLILIPQEEKSIHYHFDEHKNAKQVEIIEADVDFYMEFNPWKKMDNAKLVKMLPYKPTQLSITGFKNKVWGKRIDEATHSESFLDRVKAIFS
ncbi:MAG: phytanoyl-CoA dioxygenase family protein [Chitinophagales bacterium]